MNPSFVMSRKNITPPLNSCILETIHLQTQK
uniref:Uncharacterized protein n=1 Tax=Rhizophora mucronata TaxID=61149 RepID=A0A2P2R110_RHIMU